MVPRRCYHQCVSKGQLKNLKHLVIIAQAGGNQQLQVAIVRAATAVIVAQAREDK
jgi:hypothetical protein